MSHRKYNTGIIGYGKVAHIHASALKKIENANFTAVCGRDENKSKQFASAYNINSYTSITEMIEKEKMDIVTVCTPHPIHMDSTFEAIDAGANVLVEKPMAISVKHCDLMIDASKRAKKTIGVISQRRLYPSCLRIKKAIDNGKIGKPVFGTVNMLGWRDKKYYDSDSWRGTWSGEGGGVLVNQAPHQIDLLQWFMGSEIDEIYGVAKNLNHPYIEVEDTALAIIKFKNGSLGNIVVSNSQKPGLFGKVHIHGENGSSVGVQTDGGAMFIAGMSKVTEAAVNDIWTIPGEENLLSNWIEEDKTFFNEIDATEYFHFLQIKDFIDAINENRKPLITVEEGKRTVEIFNAIYLSTLKNKPIKFPIPSEYTESNILLSY